MVITTTAIAFLLSGLGLVFCGLWFFKAFRKIGGLKSNNQIGILLSGFFLGNSLQHIILAIGGFFFAKNSDALQAILVIDNLILAIITALGVYLIFYILFPNVSPRLPTIITLIYGLFVVSMTIFSRPKPLLTSSLAIDWNMSPLTELSLYYLLLLNIGAPFLIFLKNLFNTTSRDVRLISLIIVIATAAGLVNISIAFLDFLKSYEDLRVFIFDRVLGVIGILFVAGFLLMPLFWRLITKRFYGK